MSKVNLGRVNALYPSLTTIVGVVVDGKPNFITIAHVGIMNHGTPQYISIGVNKVHYSTAGLHEHGQFSVNLPSVDLVEKTDYAGIVSGKNTDKSTLFDVFSGELEHAPMIRECPVNMECALHEVVDFPSHEVFIGEIKTTWCDDACLLEGKVDVSKVRPLLFDMNSVQYWSLGEAVGQCWSAGKTLKK